MLRLKQENIKLNAKASNKTEAIQQVGSLLVATGQMQPDYIQSMMKREQVANTYLGSGIAIPHGLPDDRNLINDTGIAVLQLPQGVEWNKGETVHLVVGIAAKSDEHIEVLANLTHILSDPAAIQQMTSTTEPSVIIQRLTDPTQLAPSSAAAAEMTTLMPDAVEDATLNNSTGLHARPATVLVNLAKTFESEIYLCRGSQHANAKSMISLLKLGVAGGQTVRLMAQGSDANQAVSTLKAAIESGLEDEAETPTLAPGQRNFSFETTPIAGIAASPGLAIAPTYQLRRSKLVFSRTATNSDAEVDHLRQAIEKAKAELQALYETVQAKAGAGKAAIFQAHQELVQDPELLGDAIRGIEQQQSAAWAWQQAYERRAEMLEQLDQPLLAARATDLRDVGERVLRLLAERIETAADMPDQPVILVAEDLTPSDTAGLDPALVVGFCTASGGPTSHSAIIARSLDIPAVVGAGPAVLNLPDGTPCILDGETGNLYPHPSQPDVSNASNAQRDLKAVRDAEKLACYQPALLTDGHRVEVVANIGAAAEAEQAVNAGAEGVGLLRTEFLFLNRTQPPSEQEQLAAYTEMTQALNGLPLIIRTLDIGGDKTIPYLNLPVEANPFLGVRGVRLCFQQPDLFKTQLRAIFKASQTGPIKIMFPMIATVEEFKQAKQIAEQVRLEVGADPIAYGMMVEVPAAVMMAAEFAEVVEFFSIGTNDLTQYTLAMDRGHPVLAKQADSLHPAVLRLIDQTVRAAQAHGKWVGVCGGMAGEPLGAAILVGLGVSELSVSIPSVAAVKAKLRGMSLATAQDLAKRALRCPNVEAVRALR